MWYVLSTTIRHCPVGHEQRQGKLFLKETRLLRDTKLDTRRVGWRYTDFALRYNSVYMNLSENNYDFPFLQ